MDLEQDLRSVSDDMLRTLEQLQRLEHEKRSEAPGSTRFVRLAREIEKLAALVFAQTNTQESLAERTAVVAEQGVELSPIKEVTPIRDVSVILSEWREAERRLAASAVDSPEHTMAATDVRRLRDEYHRASSSQSNGERSAGS